ncbi:MAG: hypothetical protein GX592_05175 [Clostridiales bacterium]|nr:hypothetical protein [Clostridiales bacterium]
MGRLKKFWLVLLSASVVAVLSVGTLAAYNATIQLNGGISAARMAFVVNGSGEETQTLGMRELSPGESTTYNIVVDTSGTEVAMDVALDITASGSDLPPGLSVRVDGAPVGSAGTGTAAAVYENMSGATRTVPIVVSWSATPDQLKSQYPQSRSFALFLSVTATATQATAD